MSLRVTCWYKYFWCVKLGGKLSLFAAVPFWLQICNDLTAFRGADIFYDSCYLSSPSFRNIRPLFYYATLKHSDHIGT